MRKRITQISRQEAVGRAVALVFGICILTSSFAIAKHSNFLSAVQSSFWPRIPCRIISTSILSDHAVGPYGPTTVYRPGVMYVFEFNGREYTGDQVGISNLSTTDQHEVWESLRQQFAIGTSAVTKVNPLAPDENFLVVEGGAMYVAIVAPILLWGLGIFSIGAALFHNFNPGDKVSNMRDQPKSFVSLLLELAIVLGSWSVIFAGMLGSQSFYRMFNSNPKKALVMILMSCIAIAHCIRSSVKFLRARLNKMT